MQIAFVTNVGAKPRVRGVLMELRNRWVHFRIGDVYLPDPATLLLKLYGQHLLQGKVLDLSDSGMKAEAFAVVEVDGIEEPVIVPVERILGVL
jgi:hypothetical protein